MPTPTAFEIERAEYRAELAEEERRQWQAAAAQFPGAKRIYKHVFTDKLLHGVRECVEDHVVWSDQSTCDEFRERMTPDQHPGYECNGEIFYPFRFSHHVAVFTADTYKPQTAQQLADAREKRKAKKRAAVEREQRQSLFPEIFDDELARLQPEE